jgi:hypothetical protein
MGYTTDFNGHFTLDAPLTEEQAKYLNQFSGTRRMKRATGSLENLPPEVTRLVEDLPDPVREAVGLPVGPEGAYFVGSSENYGQEYDGTILEYNDPPEGQPGLWCQWIAVEDEDGAYTRIEWDGGEKFYEYTAWLEYIVENFLKPWGRTLNGEVEWQGEDRGDIGLLVVKDNVVTAKEGRVVYDYEVPKMSESTNTITFGGLTIDVRHVPFFGWIAAFTRADLPRQLYALGASTLEEATKEALDLATGFGRHPIHNPSDDHTTTR